MNLAPLGCIPAPRFIELQDFQQDFLHGRAIWTLSIQRPPVRAAGELGTRVA
jgi:hypothetical protein